MPRTAPSVSIQNPGAVVSSSLWNNNGPKAMGDYYLAVPICRIRATTTTSCTTGVYSAVAMNVTDVDTDSGHSNVTNNSRYTCQVAGWYNILGIVAMGAGTGQYDVFAALARNGVALRGTVQALQCVPNYLAGVTTEALVQLKVGDYVELWARQDSGGTLSTASFTDLACSMNLMWIHS